MRTCRELGVLCVAAIAACDGGGAHDPSASPVRVVEPVRVSTGLAAWHRRVRETDGVTCARAVEVGAMLCTSVDVTRMNRVFGRISLFAEGAFGARAGEVPPPDSPAMRRLLREAAGHDLEGVDLDAFFRAAGEQCARDAALCPTAEERALDRAVRGPMAASGTPYVVIAYALADASGGPTPWRANAHHELLHAQYFLDEDYRDAVAAFWSSLTDSERDAASAALAPVYATDDPELVRNEVQAYLLQEGAEGALLGPFVATMRAPLRERLRRAGASPVVLGE